MHKIFGYMNKIEFNVLFDYLKKIFNEEILEFTNNYENNIVQIIYIIVKTIFVKKHLPNKICFAINACLI